MTDPLWTKLLDLLVALEKAYPPEDEHHALVPIRGKAKPLLGLRIEVGDTYQLFFLDAADLTKSNEELVAEILAALREKK